MIVMQMFYPGDASRPARLSLQASRRLRIVGQSSGPDVRTISPVLRGLRRLGAWSHSSLIVRVPLGHAIHYAGTLPMKDKPGPYECDRLGRLHGTRAVFIADSASFTRLPAKNMSLAMMAGAMRIAREIARQLPRL